MPGYNMESMPDKSWVHARLPDFISVGFVYFCRLKLIDKGEKYFAIIPHFRSCFDFYHI